MTAEIIDLEDARAPAAWRGWVRGLSDSLWYCSLPDLYAITATPPGIGMSLIRIISLQWDVTTAPRSSG